MDTGSEITIVAQDMLKEEVEIEPRGILRGISGNDHLVPTTGITDAKIIAENIELPDQFNLVDRRYAGPYDGYLGHAFLKGNKAVIDMKENKIELKIDIKQKPAPAKEAEKNTRKIAKIVKTMKIEKTQNTRKIHTEANSKCSHADKWQKWK